MAGVVGLLISYVSAPPHIAGETIHWAHAQRRQSDDLLSGSNDWIRKEKVDFGDVKLGQTVEVKSEVANVSGKHDFHTHRPPVIPRNLTKLRRPCRTGWSKQPLNQPQGDRWCRSPCASEWAFHMWCGCSAASRLVG